MKTIALNYIHLWPMFIYEIPGRNFLLWFFWKLKQVIEMMLICIMQITIISMISFKFRDDMMISFEYEACVRFFIVDQRHHTCDMQYITEGKPIFVYCYSQCNENMSVHNVCVATARTLWTLQHEPKIAPSQSDWFNILCCFRKPSQHPIIGCWIPIIAYWIISTLRVG